MSSKSFVKIIVSVVTVFFLANVILYFGVVDNSARKDKSHGDLCGLAGLDWSNTLTEQKKYSKKHIEFVDYLKRLEQGENVQADIITFGDSFSNGGGGAYYQDYLVEKYGLTVLNVPTMKGMEALYMIEALDKGGYLAQLKPRYIIVETVERYLLGRYAQPKPNLDHMNTDKINAFYLKTDEAKPVTQKTAEQEQQVLLPGYMVARNKAYLGNWYKMVRKGKTKDVGWVKLNTELFTAEGDEDELMYLLWDFTQRIDGVEQANSNIESVAAYCRERGIELIFLPCPDKSTVYYPYLVQDGREYAEKTYLDELAAQPHSYYLVDAKGVLRAAAARGEKDLYWADDTHWSWRGFELVVDEMMRHIEY